MKLIARLTRLSFAEVRLLTESVIALAFIRLGLKLMRFQTLRRLVRKASAGTPDAPKRRVIGKVVWSINAISTYLPFFRNCLTRALATQLLLGRRGQQVDLRIGVKRDAGAEFKAHAWIESEGRIVLGSQDDLSEMTPLPALTLHDNLT